MGEVVICHGPAGVDRSRRLLEERLRKFPGRSTGSLCIVASRWRKQQLVQRFLKANPCAFEIPILTFQDLTGSLFRELGTGRRVVSETGRRCLLEAVLEEQLPAPDGNGEEQPVSLTEAEAWVSMLKGRGLTSEPLIRLQLQREDRNQEEASRLIPIFLAYQRRLEEQGWEDAAGVRLRLYEALLTGSLDCRHRFPRLGEILFEGLVARTPVEKGLVRLLADQVGKAVFSLDLESPDEETSPFALPVSMIGECWEGANAAWRYQPADTATAQVRFCRPAHREAEIRTVAREIQALKTRNPQPRWSRVGVVCPRDEGYLLLLKEIFSRFEIPWLNLHGDALGSTEAFRVVTGCVELLWRDFRRDDLFDFLSSPWIDPDGISPDRVRRLEQLAGRGGFGGGVEAWTRWFPDWIQQKRAESPEEPGPIPEDCVEVFRQLVRRLQADPARLRTAAEWVSLLAARLGPLLLPAAGPENWGRTEGQALARVQASLQEAALTWGDCPLSLARFRSFLHRQLSRLRISPSLDRDAVVVGSARQLQECEFRHLYWLDFSEGRIPSRRPTPFPETGVRAPEELSMFHGLCRRSRESVLLTSPRQGENGPVLPSHVLEYLDYREEALTHKAPPPEAAPARGENVRRGVRVLALRRSGRPNAFAGVLDRTEVLDRMRRRHFPAGMDLSPDRLEEYGRCGFRYFARTMLGVSPPPPDLDLLREQRRLVRRILFRYSQDAGASGLPDLEDGRRRMAGIVREELEQLRQALPAVGELRWEQLQTWLLDGLEDSKRPGLLLRFLEEERERDPGSEIHSVETSLGPLVLGHLAGTAESGDGPARPVRLRGLLDRIERTPGGFQLVSYVAGQRNRLRPVREGWGFRLPLSLLLVDSLLGTAASGGFCHVSLPGYLQWRPLHKPGRRAPAEDVKRLLERYREEALAAARRIYSGTFPVTPHKPAAAGCAHCSYSRICRREEARAGGTPA